MPWGGRRCTAGDPAVEACVSWRRQRGPEMCRTSAACSGRGRCPQRAGLEQQSATTRIRDARQAEWTSCWRRAPSVGTLDPRRVRDGWMPFASWAAHLTAVTTTGQDAVRGSPRSAQFCEGPPRWDRALCRLRVESDSTRPSLNSKHPARRDDNGRQSSPAPTQKGWSHAREVIGPRCEPGTGA